MDAKRETTGLDQIEQRGSEIPESAGEALGLPEKVVDIAEARKRLAAAGAGVKPVESERLPIAPPEAETPRQQEDEIPASLEGKIKLLNSMLAGKDLNPHSTVEQLGRLQESQEQDQKQKAA